MKLILHYLKNYKLLFFINVLSVFGFALVELGHKEIRSLYQKDKSQQKPEIHHIIFLFSHVVKLRLRFTKL